MLFRTATTRCALTTALKDISYGGGFNVDSLGFFYGWKGTWRYINCRRLLDDDDIKDSVANLESRFYTAPHAAWEKTCETLPLESNHKQFDRSNNFKIYMTVNQLDENKSWTA
jgi:hypothetical protein